MAKSIVDEDLEKQLRAAFASFTGGDDFITRDELIDGLRPPLAATCAWLLAPNLMPLTPNPNPNKDLIGQDGILWACWLGKGLCHQL